MKYWAFADLDEGLICGGDIIMLKHAESNGFLTIEENVKEDKDDSLRAYLWSVWGEGHKDEFSAHSMFEVEIGDENEKGKVMIHKSHSLPFRLRHFISGRYLGLKVMTDKNVKKKNIYRKRWLLSLIP